MKTVLGAFPVKLFESVHISGGIFSFIICSQRIVLSHQRRPHKFSVEWLNVMHLPPPVYISPNVLHLDSSLQEGITLVHLNVLLFYVYTCMAMDHSFCRMFYPV